MDSVDLFPLRTSRYYIYNWWDSEIWISFNLIEVPKAYVDMENI